VTCTVCGDPKTVAKGRCGTCWTEAHVIRLTEKDIEKERARHSA
jgi:hypothetical protein